MNWNIVAEWMCDRGYIQKHWSEYSITDDGVYCRDDDENTFVSVFTNAGRLVLFVGIVNPRFSVGGDTDCECNTCWDAIDYIRDYIDEYWESLDARYMAYIQNKCK